MASPGDEIRIGISACLLGEPVRYDGGHKRDSFLVNVLGKVVTFVPVCPEVEVGMGTPRETLRLVRRADGLHTIAKESGADHTRAMREYAERRVAALQAMDLTGYILKKDSPSCGMEHVKVYDTKSAPSKSGQGLFAEALLRRCPLLPVEEEGRLQDARLRENFLERVFAFHRLRRFFASRWQVGDLVTFHTAEKFLVLAHDPAGYQALGRLVAGAKRAAHDRLATAYQGAFMTALKKVATARRHTNVLEHLAGFFKEQLSKDEKQELMGLVRDYRQGLVPLIVPLTLVRYYVRLYDVGYLKGQTYLELLPKELMAQEPRVTAPPTRRIQVSSSSVRGPRRRASRA